MLKRLVIIVLITALLAGCIPMLSQDLEQETQTATVNDTIPQIVQTVTIVVTLIVVVIVLKIIEDYVEWCEENNTCPEKNNKAVSLEVAFLHLTPIILLF